LLATLSQPELRRDDASLPLSTHNVVYVGIPPTWTSPAPSIHYPHRVLQRHMSSVHAGSLGHLSALGWHLKESAHPTRMCDKTQTKRESIRTGGRTSGRTGSMESG
jgi:hypothetical protein